MSAPFDPDFLDRFFGPSTNEAPARPAPKPEPKPLPQIRGKRIDDVLYLHAGDLADALESQSPKTNRRLIDRLRRALGRAA